MRWRRQDIEALENINDGPNHEGMTPLTCIGYTLICNE